MNGNGNGEEISAFEMAIVVPKKEGYDVARDCVEFLVRELKRAGLIIDRVNGISDEFIKVAAPMRTLGEAAADLQIKKLTYVGVDLPFDWDQVTSFVRQPDGSLFSWCERFSCFRHVIYGIVNNTAADLTLWCNRKEFKFQRNESLLKRMEMEGIIKQVFPMHEEPKRKQLLRSWALNWLDFTWQPIDEIYSYFGTKIATYFAFLGMYTRWLFFPAGFGLAVQMIDFGSMQLFVLPAFFIFIVSWAAFFFQFWKRKNSALLARWGIDGEIDFFDQCKGDTEKKLHADRPAEKKILQRDEWLGLMLRIRNNAIIVVGIICLQLPFELAYAHFYEIAESVAFKFILTAVYLLAIQYYTKIGGKVSVALIKYENNEGEESSADSLVYKVLENVIENSIPYLKYSYKKYKAVHKKKHEKGSQVEKSVLATRVEKEYLKPSYTASIGKDLEDGLFDDFLELALQFGMIMMFACAFPLLFCFATLNNVTEIRTDALKLLVMLKRPVPRATATIGAWLNIFQFLIVMAICTNCVLLVCLYDQEGKWRIEPGLAAILIMEHVLLLIKFGFSHFVPEEPAWVKASRVRTVARNTYSKQLLRSISNIERKRD